MARPYTIATFLFSHSFPSHTLLLIFYSSSYNKTLTFRITIFILLFIEVHHIYSALNLIERNKSNHHTYLLDKSEPKKRTPPSKSKKRTSKTPGGAQAHTICIASLTTDTLSPSRVLFLLPLASLLGLFILFEDRQLLIKRV